MTGHLVELPPLTRLQEDVLLELFDADPLRRGELRFEQSKLRAARVLKAKDLAAVVHRAPLEKWFTLTDRGRQVAEHLKARRSP